MVRGDVSRVVSTRRGSTTAARQRSVPAPQTPSRHVYSARAHEYLRGHGIHLRQIMVPDVPAEASKSRESRPVTMEILASGTPGLAIHNGRRLAASLDRNHFALSPRSDFPPARQLIPSVQRRRGLPGTSVECSSALQIAPPG